MVIDLNDAGGQEAPRKDKPVPLNVAQAVESFQAEIEARGYGRPDIEPDGEIHRFPGPRDKAGEKSAWYVLFLDNPSFIAGSYGYWADDSTFTWCSKSAWELSKEEKAQQKEILEAARRKRDLSRERASAEAAEKARAILAMAPVAPEDHPYLVKKQVRPFDLRLGNDGCLLVPMYDQHAVVQGFQRIFPNGEKRYLTGVSKQGRFHLLNGDQSVLYICEGYATGASVHMATGAAVAIAFDRGNLLPAGQAIREAFPFARLVFCADNDRWTKGNPGVADANKAAEALGASVLVPEFLDLAAKPTDFNDLHVAEGIEALRLALDVDRGGLRVSKWGMDLFSGPAPKFDYLAEGLVPMASPTILAAAGGTGKGYLLLDLGLKVASKKPDVIDLGDSLQWLGARISRGGRVVMILAEDCKAEVHRRLEALDPDGSMRRAAEGRLFIVTLPDAGGPVPVAVHGDGGPVEMPAWQEVRRQIERLQDLALIVLDPLASFTFLDINADPQAAAFMNSCLAMLAAKTGAAVVVAHHMAKSRKGDKGDMTVDMARDGIRGSSAIVDGVRSALVIWKVAENKARSICAAAGEEWARDKVFEAAVVKSNGPADLRIRSLIRDKRGLLLDRDLDIAEARGTEDGALVALENDIAQAARDGRPFTHTGVTGVFNRRSELTPTILDHWASKHGLESLVRRLLDDGRIVKCSVGKVVARYLDVPSGPFASGVGEIVQGKTVSERSRAASRSN